MSLFKKNREVRLSNSTIVSYEFAKRIMGFFWKYLPFEIAHCRIKTTEETATIYKSVATIATYRKGVLVEATITFRLLKRGYSFEVSGQTLITMVQPPSVKEVTLAMNNDAIEIPDPNEKEWFEHQQHLAIIKFAVA